MNISPVNFKGTYCISSHLQPSGAVNSVLDKQDEYSMSIVFSGHFDYNKFYVSVPEKLDEKFKQELSKLGLRYENIDEIQALKPQNIFNRTILSDEAKDRDYILQTVDVERLDRELKQHNECYVGLNGVKGSGRRYENFKQFLKTNQKIEAPMIYLLKFPDGTIKTRMYDGNHRFAVLRDMGLKNIRIAIHKNSLLLAQQVGIIK